MTLTLRNVNGMEEIVVDRMFIHITVRFVHVMKILKQQQQQLQQHLQLLKLQLQLDQVLNVTIYPPRLSARVICPGYPPGLSARVIRLGYPPRLFIQLSDVYDSLSYSIVTFRANSFCSNLGRKGVLFPPFDPPISLMEGKYFLDQIWAMTDCFFL